MKLSCHQFDLHAYAGQWSAICRTEIDKWPIQSDKNALAACCCLIVFCIIIFNFLLCDCFMKSLFRFECFLLSLSRSHNRLDFCFACYFPVSNRTQSFCNCFDAKAKHTHRINVTSMRFLMKTSAIARKYCFSFTLCDIARLQLGRVMLMYHDSTHSAPFVLDWQRDWQREIAAN